MVQTLPGVGSFHRLYRITMQFRGFENLFGWLPGTASPQHVPKSLDAKGEKKEKEEGEGEEEEEDNRDAGAETFSALAESRRLPNWAM